MALRAQRAPPSPLGLVGVTARLVGRRWGRSSRERQLGLAAVGSIGLPRVLCGVVRGPLGTVHRLRQQGQVQGGMPL